MFITIIADLSENKSEQQKKAYKIKRNEKETKKIKIKEVGIKKDY